MKTKSKRFVKSVINTLLRPDMSILPGSLAFFFVLALVPTITLITYIASFFKISINDINQYFNIHLSFDFLDMLKPNIAGGEFHFSMLFLILICIYLASNGTNSVIVTADNIYGIKQDTWLKRRIKAIIMVFIIIVLFLFLLIVPVFGNFLMSLMRQKAGASFIYTIMTILKYPFSWLVVYIFTKILYTIAPDKDIPSVYVTKGALFTSFGWIIATIIYTFWSSHVARYTLYYSGLASAATLMIWIYILSFIFVIGMGINYMEEPYEIEKTQAIEANKLVKKMEKYKK